MMVTIIYDDVFGGWLVADLKYFSPR